MQRGFSDMQFLVDIVPNIRHFFKLRRNIAADKNFITRVKCCNTRGRNAPEIFEIMPAGTKANIFR